MLKGIVKKEIQGKFKKYTELKSVNGYCFYDIDDPERTYMTSILTPITDTIELERKYVVVRGNAEQLNEESQKEREDEND